MPKVTKLPSGRWRARAYDYTDEKGVRHYKSFTADTKNEAMLAALAHKPRTVDKNAAYDELTLSAAYKRYIDGRAKTLAPSTIAEYRRQRKRDFPALMKMQLKDITPEIVQTAVNEAAQTASPKTVRNMHGLLHKVLKCYAPRCILNTDLPQKEKTPVYVPTSDEVAAALNAADEWLYVPILLASQGSLRRSEICALTPDDVTPFGVTINKAMVKDENKKFVIKPPKTNAGYRTCPLPLDVIKQVQAWQHFGITPDKLEHKWQAVKKSEKLPFKFHAFRHYWASLLHSKGLPDQYIAATGGWSSVEMLHKIYAHALRDKKPEFNDQIVNIFADEFAVIDGGKNKKQA